VFSPDIIDAGAGDFNHSVANDRRQDLSPAGAQHAAHLEYIRKITIEVNTNLEG